MSSDFPGYGWTTQDANYVVLTFQQYIQVMGIPLTYKQRVDTGTNIYGQPTYTFSSVPIQGIVASLSQEEYQYIEPGFTPQHYAKLWQYTITNPQIGDHVVYQNIEFEIRGVWPRVVSSPETNQILTVFYQLLLRRII
jgi:hypothetical protein